MSYWTTLFIVLRKLQRAHHTLRGHFAPAYLGGSNKLRAYLFFIYGLPVEITGTESMKRVIRTGGTIFYTSTTIKRTQTVLDM